MVVGYIGLANIGLYLYVFVIVLVAGVLVVTAYKMRSRRVWIIGVGLVVLVILGIGIFPFWAYVLIGGGWPGMYVYTERRSFETTEEAVALRVAETFNYALIPVNESTNLSDSSFYQGALEYSLVPVSGAIFLSNDTLFEYAVINHTFNPFLIWGRRAISYVANCTHFPTLNVTLNSTSIESYGDKPVVFASNSGTIVQPWGPDAFFSWWPCSFWRGGYWEGSNYTGFEYNRFGDYSGPSFLCLNYTDVFFIDMRLRVIRSGAGSYGWYDEFWFYQRAVVDQLGRVLFVSYHGSYRAQIM